MHNAILTGADQQQEWLLPWWYAHLRKHSSLPILFADFGMSPEKRAWCAERGELLDLPPFFLQEPDPSQLEKWQKIYGATFWKSRLAWFKKPLALAATHAQKNLWLDLDCEVTGPLDPLLALCPPRGVALLPEPPETQEPHVLHGLLPWEATLYNAGVVLYEKGAPYLQAWVDEVVSHNGDYPTEQHAFAHALLKRQLTPQLLPPIYNQLRPWLTSAPAVIKHWIMEEGKEHIRNSM